MPFAMVLKKTSPSDAMAVPIWTAEAPASMYSMASCHVVIPPEPMMGTSTASYVS